MLCQTVSHMPIATAVSSSSVNTAFEVAIHSLVLSAFRPCRTIFRPNVFDTHGCTLQVAGGSSTSIHNFRIDYFVTLIDFRTVWPTLSCSHRQW